MYVLPGIFLALCIIFFILHHRRKRKNKYLYLAALDFYFQKGFTYLELGDGDELWENRSVKRIREIHEDSFEMVKRIFAIRFATCS